MDHASWLSRHPVAAPYFLEFVPLIGEHGGVSGFDEKMAYEDLIPADGPNGDLGGAGKLHVERLIELARSRKRRPVLACTRSLGRTRALKATFGGHSIFLHRNLFHQWASYRSLAEGGNPFFIGTIVKTVLASSRDPFLKIVGDWFQLGERPPNAEALFEVFIILHLYLYSIAYDASDLIIDVTAMASDNAARAATERQLSDMVGCTIDLTDLREECAFTTFTDAAPQRVRDTVEQFVKLMPTAAMTDEAFVFIQTSMQRALAEWERFEFFNRRMRSVLVAEIDDVKRLLKTREAEIERLQAQTAQLAHDLSVSQRLLAASPVEGDQAPRSCSERGAPDGACTEPVLQSAAAEPSAPQAPASEGQPTRQE